MMLVNSRPFLILIVLIFFHFNLSAQNDTTYVSISKAISYALENNYQMQNAKQDVLIAKKKIWETTAAGLPQVSGKIDYNNNLTVGTIPLSITDPTGKTSTSYIKMGTPHSMSASILVTQLIFDGSYIVALQASQTYKKISELAELKTESLVIESVTNAYGGVVLNEESIKILEANVEAVRKNLEQTKAYYENGLTEEQNVEQLKILLSSLENTLFNSKKEKETSQQMLKFLLGMDLSTEIALSDGLEFLLLQNLTTPNKQFDTENTVDIQIENNKVKSQKLLRKLEQAKYLPSINAFYKGGKDAFGETFDFFKFDPDQWYGSQVVGISLNMPIFSSFQRHSKVQQAKIEYLKVQNSRSEKSQKLLLDIQRANNTYLSSINMYYTAKENMELSKKIRDKESIKYFEGMSSSLDLLDAEVQMFTAQNSYIRAIQSLITSRASMEMLMTIVPESNNDDSKK